MVVNMPMELLRSFTVIVDAGSMRKATERVFVTQSALSLQMKRLEELVQTPLFQRDGRWRLILTQAGQSLLGHARDILDANDRAPQALSGDVLTGPARIGFVQDFAETLLSGVLARFTQLNPENPGSGAGWRFGGIARPDACRPTGRRAVHEQPGRSSPVVRHRTHARWLGEEDLARQGSTAAGGAGAALPVPRRRAWRAGQSEAGPIASCWKHQALRRCGPRWSPGSASPAVQPISWMRPSAPGRGLPSCPGCRLCASYPQQPACDDQPTGGPCPDSGAGALAPQTLRRVNYNRVPRGDFVSRADKHFIRGLRGDRSGGWAGPSGSRSIPSADFPRAQAWLCRETTDPPLRPRALIQS